MDYRRGMAQEPTSKEWLELKTVARTIRCLEESVLYLWSKRGR